MAIITRVRSLLNATSERGESGVNADGTTTEGPESSLFRCRDCDVVYIATDKSTCPNCGESVTRVPSTLRPEQEV